MVQQDPIAEFITALQEISQLHCGTALSPELCLIILFQYGGMQHPFNAVMQDTEFQYILKSLNYPANMGCVCGLFVGKWPIVNQLALPLLGYTTMTYGNRQPKPLVIIYETRISLIFIILIL